MVKIFLSGPGGSGKTTLAQALKKEEGFQSFKQISEVARELMRKKNLNCDDLQQYDIDQFIDFQEEIVIAQCTAEEENIVHENVISDRSVLDCLAYTLWKTDGGFESEKFRELISRNKAMLEEAVKRYKQSLFFLVHPWNDKATKDDGIRMPLSANDCVIYTSLLKQLLQNFEIEFIELSKPELKNRITIIVESALRKGR